MCGNTCAKTRTGRAYAFSSRLLGPSVPRTHNKICFVRQQHAGTRGLALRPAQDTHTPGRTREEGRETHVPPSGRPSARLLYTTLTN